MKRKSLFVTFIVSLVVSVILGTVLPASTQSPTVVNQCDQLKVKIQTRAEKDANADRFAFFNNDKKKKTINDILRLYHDEKSKASCFKKDQLWDIYEEKYDTHKNSSWMPVILILFLGTVFGASLKDTLSKAFNRSVKEIGKWLYKKFAGTRLFENIVLEKYRKALIKKYQKLDITFRHNRPLEMREFYVPLKVAGTIDSSLIAAENAVQKYSRLMIKGAPGSGKSTLLKYIVLSYAEGRLRNFSGGRVPVLLELNRLNNPDLTPESLQQELVKACDRNDFPKAGRFVSQSLNDGDLILLLDGLDEVSSSVRPHVIKCLKDLLDKYQKCQAILTCRTAVYNNQFFYFVDQTLEITEFSDRQIRNFLEAWKSEMPPDKSVEQLITTLRDRPRIMALARNPLLLTIIAYLYSDTPFVLPHSRAEFYTKATDVLLELRDQRRSIINQYTAYKKRLVLQHLALYAQSNSNRQQQDRRSLSYREVQEQVKQVLPSLNLEPKEATEIVSEIVNRSGLLLRIDGGQRFQFAHLTLQEYFVAAELVDKQSDLIQKWQGAPSDWREIVKLWCGLANNSTNLIETVYQSDPLTGFECLADARQIKPELAEKIINDFQVKLGTVSDNEKDAVERAFAAVAADQRPRGKTVFRFLEQKLKISEEISVRTIAANALSLTNSADAVKTLADCYSNHPEVRQPLIRMGDLAVPSLEYLVNNGSLNALDDLTEIKTPKAVKAILPLLWNQNKGLAESAAWRLAALLPQPNIEETFRDQELSDKQKQADYLKWVWEPFIDKKQGNSNLSIIVGRIAKLIATSSIDSAPATTVQLDPRIVIPLCAVEVKSNIDFTRLKSRDDKFPEPLNEFINKISSEESEAKFRQKNIDSTQDSASSLASIGNLASLNLEKVFNKNLAKIFNILSQQSSNPELTTLKVEFVRKCLETANADPLWRRLFESLESNLRFELFHRLLWYFSSNRDDSTSSRRDDWRNIFRPLKYQFSTSWHHKTILTICIIIILVALTQMGLIFFDSSPLLSWTNVLIFLAALTLTLFSIIFCFIPEIRDEGGLLFLLVLPVFLPLSISNITNYDSSVLVVFATMFSSWLGMIYFVSIFLLTFLSWQFVMLVELIVIVILTFLWRRGYKLDRDARNPLQGILKSK